ncbi:MAG: class I SAM-dependent methyltransferase [Parachlamydiales bacterium]
MSYQLIDSGNGQKLEQFGPFIIARPAAQAVWLPQQKEDVWKKAHANFTRDGSNRWISALPLPPLWTVEVENIAFKISPTDFGHLGIFPEQQMFWRWMTDILQNAPSKPSLLNLFAYSGGVTLAAAKAGAEVCHLDASKPMVAWARENAALNNLDNAPIRWIVDDVSKFLAREQRRSKKYDAIVLDPPSFGRGPNGEVFKIEEQIIPLLTQCRALLSEKPLFIALSCHTPGFTPYIIKKLMEQAMHGLKGTVESGELLLETQQKGSYPLPSGTYAWWCHG